MIFFACAGPSQPTKFQLFVLQGIGCFEELLEFALGPLWQLPDVLKVTFEGRPIRNDKQPVIALLLAVLGLNDLENADRLACQH